MVQYARFVENQASLSTDFGLTLACRKLNIDESALAEKLGRFSKGPRKGKIKGILRWQKIVEPGWVRKNSVRYSDSSEDEASGFVCRFVNTTFGYEVFDGNTGEILIPCDAMKELEKICKENKGRQ